MCENIYLLASELSEGEAKLACYFLNLVVNAHNSKQLDIWKNVIWKILNMVKDFAETKFKALIFTVIIEQYWERFRKYKRT